MGRINLDYIKIIRSRYEEVKLKCIANHSKHFLDGFYYAVDSVVDDGIKLVARNGSIHYVPERDLICFKLKGTRHYYDFVELVIKAMKDGKVREVTIYDDRVEFTANDTQFGYGFNVAESGTDLIKSLYEETFVIETEEDLRRVQINPNNETNITLANGTKVIPSGSMDSTNKDGFALGIIVIDPHIDYFGLSILKGATVTQRRGD